MCASSVRSENRDWVQPAMTETRLTAFEAIFSMTFTELSEASHDIALPMLAHFIIAPIMGKGTQEIPHPAKGRRMIVDSRLCRLGQI